MSPVLVLFAILNAIISTFLFYKALYAEFVVSALTSSFFVLVWLNLLVFFYFGEKLFRWSGVKMMSIGNFVIKNILVFVFALVMYKLAYLRSNLSILIAMSYYVLFSLLMAKLALKKFDQDKKISE